jgi:hypothetical protein
MAEAMQQQAMNPMEMPTMPGVAISPVAGLAKMLQAYVAKRNLNKSDAEQKAYENSVSEDTARLFRNMGKTETIPGDIITPGKPSEAINENVTRVFETRVQPESFTAEEVNAAMDLPLKTEAVAPEYGPSRKVPLLSADLLNPTNPLAMKTGQGKQMLAQYLMQQQAQQQAAAQAELAASRQIQSVAPGATLFQGGKPIYTNPKDSPLREIKTNDPVTGMPVTKYYPENVLVAMGGIPDQFKGFAADLIMAKNLPAQVMNDPQLLNLVGSQLNKQAGLVTQEDVANYMLKVAETRAKLGYEGIPFAEPKPLTAATNPLVKQTLPKGVPLGAVSTGKFTPEGKPVYKTPDGKNHVED